MLDAPVSGGDIGAINGTLSIMVGGDAAAFAKAKPILDVMGIKHELVESERDVAKIKPAIDWAYANSKPVAILLGCPPRIDQ